MSLERTLSIVKPDGVRKNVIGDVYHRFEKAGLRIVAARMMRLTQAQAEAFYGIHRERPFFKDLVSYMVSGPVIVQVLEGEGAVARNRDVMGATDPKKAAPGTIRADLADSIEQNVVHGSDSAENAARVDRRCPGTVWWTAAVTASQGPRDVTGASEPKAVTTPAAGASWRV